MASDYTMKNNLKLREYVMIKLLSEVYYQKEYPQTTILTILDSVARFGGFKENKLIANNIYERLTDLAIGAHAPEFMIVDNGKVVDLKQFEGKHLYLFFVDPTSQEQRKQLDLLIPIYNKYYKAVNFLMVIKNERIITDQELMTFKNAYPWESIAVNANNELFKSYKVAVTPSYNLIDAAGYLVAAPALGPLPNGQYETIDKTFFAIQKVIDSQNER
jgi:septin family protein